MTDTVLQQLSDAQAALTAALDMRDVDAIDDAAAALATAIDEVRVVGGWRERPGLRDELILVLRNAEVVRGRVNKLADANHRKLEKLISLTGAPRAISYGRSGKLG